MLWHRLSNRGYSAIDLVVGLALLGILCSTSIPSLHAREGANLRTLTNELLRAIDRSALLAEWSGASCKITANDHSISLTREHRLPLEILHLPPNYEVEFDFSTINNEPGSLVLWGTGKASAGQIRIYSKTTRKSCIIFQGLFGQRRIQCDF